MRWLAILAAVFVLNATPAFAQLPSQLRSAGITEAEWRVARETIEREARLRGQREAVLQTLAIEIFQAQPGQPFETYVALIEAGAERLPQALAAAQALDPGRDPSLRRLKARAVGAARDGRLQEALRAQDEYATELQSAITRLTERPQLELAAAHAAGAETASALADFRGAAARYDLASKAAPEMQSLVRWRYRMAQAQALSDRGVLFADIYALVEATRVLREEALPLVPKDTRFVEYARTIIASVQPYVDIARLDPIRGYNDLAYVFRDFDELKESLDRTEHPELWADALIQFARLSTVMTEIGASDFFGDDRALLWEVQGEAIYTRETHPQRWADIESYLGDANLIWTQRVGDGAVSAVPSYNAALTVYTREQAPRRWAELQEKLAIALWVFDGDLAASMAAFEAAMTVRQRDTMPGAWAQTQMRRGDISLDAVKRGQVDASHQAISAYRNALAIYEPERARAPSPWAQAGTGLGLSLLARAAGGDFEEAESVLAAVLAAERVGELDEARAQFALARLQLAQGRSSEARTNAAAALEIFGYSVSRADEEAARSFLESIRD
jgi:hypothetical protein